MVAQRKNSSKPEKGASKRSKGKPIERHQAKADQGNKKKFEADTTKTTTSTRLCIKNVPPSFSSLQLRDYLKKEYCRRQQNNEELVITDCRVLMHPQKKTSRRIAFTGVQSAQMAQNVIKLFHQTFALTSRLSVEFAHAGNIKKKDEPEEKEPGKETKEVTKSAKDSSAKSLLIAGAGSKNKDKFWSNDLDLTGGAIEEDVPAKGELQPKDNEMYNDPAPNDDDNSSSSSSDSDSSDDEADPLVRSTTSSTKPKISDFDFLKSKQKMVNDLDADGHDDLEKEEETKEKEIEKDTESSSESDSDTDSDDSSSAASASKTPAEGQHTMDDAQDEPKDDKLSAADSRVDTEKTEDDESISDEDTAGVASDRLFVRNVPFTTTEEELEEHFATFGSVSECHIPVDDRKTSKGFAFVTFGSRQDAASALEALDGTDFQGRYLHILPSRQKPKVAEDVNMDDPINDRPLSYKERQELARRQEATKSSNGWSASFVRGDAVVDSLADRLGLKKGDILNVKEGLSSGDAAVRLALGETQVIEENRAYFKEHGIDMEALVSAKPNDSSKTAETMKRSTTSLLVKNLPYDTLVDELNKVFHGVGDAPKRILLPPSRTIALVEFSHSSDAKKAFRKLAYRRFKSVPLYLEWAPLEAIEPSTDPENESQKPDETKEEPMESNEEEVALEGPTPSIYVKNLNFSTSEEALQNYFQKAVGDVRAARIPTKLAPVKKSRVGNKGTGESDAMQSLSMGFGFVEFATHESARKALTKLQGCLVDGHALELKPSTKSLMERTVKVPASNKNPTKITVRNVPFQASRTEILKLFGSFGQLKRVRLPKKFDGGHRGFAFVEFVTHKEALAAMKALSRTHLYGRHLVLEWADDDSAAGLDALRQKAQRDVQANGESGGSRVNKRQKLS